MSFMIRTVGLGLEVLIDSFLPKDVGSELSFLNLLSSREGFELGIKICSRSFLN